MVKWSPHAVSAILVSMTLAGCLDGTDAGARADSGQSAFGVDGTGSIGTQFVQDWSERVLLVDNEHSHGDHSQHLGLTTPNFEVIGWDPLRSDYHGTTPGSHLCGDANEANGRTLSAVHSFSTDIAAILTDVTDPANPKKLGELVMANTHVYDLAITPDQQYLLLATSPLDTGPDAQAPPVQQGPWSWRDACTGQEKVLLGPEAGLPFASGIVLVDIANPQNPSVVDFRFFPILGGHSVHAREINGETLILATVANLPGQASFYVFMDIVGSPAGGKLEILNIYQWRPEEPQAYAAMALNTNHDGYLQVHPVTGQALAYLAYGDDGLVILNVDDPRNPVFLSHWADWAAVGGPDGSHYFHEAMPIEGTWDGKHYTFTGEECSSHPPNYPTCLAYAFETTDPSNPKLVGVWTLPHDVPWTAGLQYSLHYLAVVGQTLFISAYHGGLWAVDVSALTDEVQNLRSIGVFMPDNIPPTAPFAGASYSPRVNDLTALSDGTMVVYDAQTGLYTLRFDASSPAPAPEPWSIV